MIETSLRDYPAVALLGARQAGKTTLARHIGDARAAVYLDIERPSDRQKLTDMEAYLSLHSQRLVILDEVQHMPELFPVLRSWPKTSKAPCGCAAASPTVCWPAPMPKVWTGDKT